MSRTFRKLCLATGFIFTKDIYGADIVFAHSGGALLLPAELPARLVLLVGPAYWPGRSWLAATRLHLQTENAMFRLGKARKAQIAKWCYRLVYFFKLHTAYRMKRNQRLDAPWNSTYKQVIIRNKDDAYSTPGIGKLHFNGQRTFISMPGGHDDCWDHAERYVHLIQSLYGSGS